MSDSQSAQTQETSQQDNRNVLGENATLVQSGGRLTQIDGRTNNQLDARQWNDSSTNIDASVHNTLDAVVANNAITSATDAAVTNLRESLSFGGGALDGSFRFGRDALAYAANGENRVLDSMTQSNDMVKNAYADAKGRGAMTDKLTMAALAMAGIVAVMALKGKA